ncbi:103aa long hypothetical protein [Pyrococcus horikoshii OT3]|uniref:Uncharacterized protein n=1 Tax=Pyrococcus horikoshii (strain ATCC 700860 / DSM 12428 / JCM 9974 / NBRC 100139 / OT-3) TaxID=70601 RepID=O58596_PYRHO|nr:103aa long hypothetical protein [Pyrococcus horikoshii OT3]
MLLQLRNVDLHYYKEAQKCHCNGDFYLRIPQLCPTNNCERYCTCRRWFTTNPKHSSGCIKSYRRRASGVNNPRSILSGMAERTRKNYGRNPVYLTKLPLSGNN